MKEYSCSNNCIKIKPDGVDEKVKVSKLYLQVPIKDLFADIIKPPSLGVLTESIYNNVYFIVIEFKLREFLPSQVKLMSNQIRDFCGC